MPEMTAPGATIAALSIRERRQLAAQIHVSACLLLAAGLLWKAGDQLRAADRWELQWILLAAAALALVHAVLPWVYGCTLRAQRAGIWQALILATLPAAASITTVGFAAVGACQLLLIAAVLAELGARQRILWFFWALLVLVFLISLWHLRYPVL